MPAPVSRRFAVLAAGAVLVASACTGAKNPSAVSQEPPSAGATDATGNPLPGSSTAPGASGVPSEPGGAAPGASSKPGGGGAGSGGGTTATAGPVAGGGTVRGGKGITLYSGADNTTGITPTSLTFCTHAALTYGAAFDTTADDFNVYWDALNAKGGIYGRKVNNTWKDDKYTPQDAIIAANDCKALKPFMLIGGIGFDQIPAVRNWAEDNKMLYMHHAATVKGSAGKRFSYTGLPTVEKLGEMFGELALQKYRGKKIAIMHRDSINWDPGLEAFLALAKAKGLNIVKKVKTYNDHNHLQRVIDTKNSKAEVVWLWENALVSTEIITAADQQDYHPAWMAFPFNLTTQTLKDVQIDGEMLGIAAWPAYSFGDTSGPFAAYAEDIIEFEKQYAKYRPRTRLNSLGGDLLFLNWVGQKAMHQMFLACGKDCTRNAFASLFHNGIKLKAQGCTIDFGGNPYRGSNTVNLFDTYDSPSGKRNWRPLNTCREHL